MNAEQLKARIEQLDPSTHVEVWDLTGTQDHWQALVVSEAFRGKMMVDQHRMVKGLLQKEIESNEVHALSLKTYTPEQYEKYKK